MASKLTRYLTLNIILMCPVPISKVYLMTGSKQVDHWTSGTVYEYSEIAGSPQSRQIRGLHSTQFWVMNKGTSYVS